MRLFRASVAAAVAAAAFARPLSAQTGTFPFQDAWYWGAYGGQLSFPTSVERKIAPTIGGDWMITRPNMALRVFAEQSYFDATSTITDYPTGAPRIVTMTDMRRIGVNAMLFTPPINNLRPYFGLGYAFNFIREAAPLGSYFASTPTVTADSSQKIVLARVNSARTAGKLFGQVGMLYTWRRWAPFVEYTVMPSQGAKKWLVNGDGFTSAWSVGVRFNVGTSIEKKW